MYALVTGGAGFIGSNLCSALLSQGYGVTCIDNLHTGSLDNIAAFRSNPKFSFHQADSGQVGGLGLEKPDVILHNGIYSSSPMYKEDPRRFASVLDEFIRLLEYGRARDVPLVFASSSSLYNGIPPPHTEDLPIRVSDYYTEGRFAMERLAELYHALYGMKVIALRYFSVYGPNERSKGPYANLISQFLWALMKNEAPIIYGDGSQTRDFIHVEDVVRANLLAAQSRTRFGVFNVGTGHSISINDMLAILQTGTGKKIAAKYVPNSIRNYVAHTQADTRKAEKELGFRAKVKLEEGIERLIAHYKEHP